MLGECQNHILQYIMLEPLKNLPPSGCRPVIQDKLLYKRLDSKNFLNYKVIRNYI